LTIEANIISNENANSAIIFNIQKVGSPFTSVTNILTSSPNKAYNVMNVMITEVILSSNTASIYFLKFIYINIYNASF